MNGKARELQHQHKPLADAEYGDDDMMEHEEN